MKALCLSLGRCSVVRTLVTLTEDQGLSSSTHSGSQLSVAPIPKDPVWCSGLWGTRHMQCT